MMDVQETEENSFCRMTRHATASVSEVRNAAPREQRKDSRSSSVRPPTREVVGSNTGQVLSFVDFLRSVRWVHPRFILAL
jgi:hypothetical protein